MGRGIERFGLYPAGHYPLAEVIESGGEEQEAAGSGKETMEAVQTETGGEMMRRYWVECDGCHLQWELGRFLCWAKLKWWFLKTQGALEIDCPQGSKEFPRMVFHGDDAKSIEKRKPKGEN